MISSTACYKATLRNVEELPTTSVVTRIGNVLERFSTDQSQEALGTCGVITNISVIGDVIKKSNLTEITIDDGINQITLAVSFTKFYEYNLGDVVQVVVKNRILSNTPDGVVYATISSTKLGEISVEDLTTSIK